MGDARPLRGRGRETTPRRKRGSSGRLRRPRAAPQDAKRCCRAFRRLARQPTVVMLRFEELLTRSPPRQGACFGGLLALAPSPPHFRYRSGIWCDHHALSLALVIGSIIAPL